MIASIRRHRTAPEDRVPARSAPSAMVWRLARRRATRTGLGVGALVGFLVAASAVSYATLYASSAQRHALVVTFGENPAIAALFGPASRLDTVAGFTAFKCSMTAMVLVSVWGLLSTTTSLRGDEAAGRLELLLQGRSTLTSAVGESMAGFAAGWLVSWVVAGLLIAGVGSRASVGFSIRWSGEFSLCVVAAALPFAALGALTSQLVSSRRRAAGWAAVALAVSYGLRLLADAGVGLSGLRWVSPLGWVELMDPVGGLRFWPLAVLSLATVVLTVLAAAVARGRDVGAAPFGQGRHRTHWAPLLRSSAGFSFLLERSMLAAWGVALLSTGLLFGFVARAAGASLSTGSIHEVLDHLGSHGAGVSAYLGLTFVILSVLLALVAANAVAAAAREEMEGRLELLQVAPQPRGSWLVARAVLAGSMVLALALGSGLAVELGVALGGPSWRGRSLLLAGANMVPAAWCVLGIGVAVLGWAPRWAGRAAYGIVIWSLLATLLGAVGASTPWIPKLSLLHYQAAVPATPPAMLAAGVLTVVGIAGVGLGWWRFSRRDLR